MPYDLSPVKKKLPEIKEWLKKELSLLRTGRASPALLDNIVVDYYGAKQPLKHLGAISAEDARTLRIKPWDASLISQIDQAIRTVGMGLQAIAEKDSLRIIFPELTQERRKALLKVISEKLEEARISIRKIRDEHWRDIQNKEREGKIPEDEKFRLKDNLQELIDKIQKELEEMVSAKEKEIQN
ncbi:MAG: ribosome recycling factor [Candidatus Tagabacteria bacterium]